MLTAVQNGYTIYDLIYNVGTISSHCFYVGLPIPVSIGTELFHHIRPASWAAPRPGTSYDLSPNIEILETLYHRRRGNRPAGTAPGPGTQSHRLASNIEALDTVYYTGGGRIGGAAKREEVVPTDSQFLQAQGLPTPLTIKHIGPGHIIPQP